MLGGVGLIKRRVKAGPSMVSVLTKLNPVMRAIGWLEQAPFKTVHLILRYGDAKPTTFFRPIIKQHSELPVARELSAVECETASRAGNLEAVFMRETLLALKDVAEKYGLSVEWLAQLVIQADAASPRRLT